MGPIQILQQGLGISFLRHIERCVCLIYVIDLSQPDPVQQFETLKYELEQYQPGLSERPHAVVANKIDLDEAKENRAAFSEYANGREGLEVFYASGKNGTNIRDVLDFIRRLKDEPQDVTDKAE